MRVNRLFVAFTLVCGLSLATAAAGGAQSTDPGTAPAPTITNPPIPSPKPTAEDPHVRKLAVQQFLAWQTATVDRDLYSDTVNGELSDDLMDRATKTLANLGALQSAVFQGISTTKGTSLYVYQMTCANGVIQMDFALDPSGKIALIFFQ